MSFALIGGGVMMKLYSCRSIWVLIALLSGGVVAAQSSDVASNPIEGVALTLAEMDRLIDSSGVSHILEDATAISADQVESQEVESWVESQKRSYANVSGLELRAGYDRKYGVGSDDIYDDFYSYKNRFDAMLSWNILKSGLIGRASNEERVDLESQRLLLDQRSALSAEQIRLHSLTQEQILNSYLNSLYSAQVKVYESLVVLVSNLHRQGQATTIDLSQVEIEMEIAKGSMRETPVEVEGLFDLSEYLLMQVMIEPAEVEALADGSISVEQSQLEEQIIGSEEDRVSYWDKASLSPYVKAQHYSGMRFVSSRVTANIGVSATLPILSGAKSRRSEIKAREVLAASTTERTRTSMILLLSQSASDLNKNLERLRSTAKLEELYHKQIESAKEAYEQKHLRMVDVAQYYLKLLLLQADIIEMIGERESLKTKLLLTII